MRGTKRSLLLVCLLALVLLVVGCTGQLGEVHDGDDVMGAPTGRVITGEEALRLYGINAEGDDEPEEFWATLEPWFPMEVWVSASLLPYDDPDPILVLPVYADSELGVQSTWVGDLEAGTSVMLISIHPDGRACIVEAVAHQGWEVEGWVACNRLIFHEPTPIAG